MAETSDFEGIEDARVPEGTGNFIREGRYRFKIIRVKKGANRKKRKFFVVEVEILESTNPERPVGTDTSWMVMNDQDGFLENVKGFAMASLGIDDPKQITAGICEGIVSASNPLCGEIVRASAVDVDMTTKTGVYTRIRWFTDDATVPIEESTASGKPADPGAEGEDVPF